MAVDLPAGTYTVNVFNFGVDKNLPLGFVDAVLDKSGNLVGFVKNNKFYNPGEKVAEPKKSTALTSKQLSNKVDLLTRKLDLNRLRAANKNTSAEERKKYVATFNETQQELNDTKKQLLETEVREGKVKEAAAKEKAADLIRFDIRSLNEQKKFLTELGQSTLEVDNKLKGRQTELDNIVNPKPIKYGAQPNQVQTGALPFGGGKVPGMKGISGPISGGVEVPGGMGGTGGTGGAGDTGGTGGTGGTGDGSKETPPAGDEDKRTPEQRYADAIAKAQQLYNMPDIIFKNIDSLGQILKRYVNKELTDNQLAREIQNDPWFRTNSSEIKARYAQLFNYQDLVKSGRAQGTTDYEQQISRISRNIQAKSRQLRGTELSDADAKLLAQDLYIYNLDGDEAVVTERLARFIRPTAGMVGGQPTIGYGGEALQNYQALQGFAKANGFKIEDILPRDAMGKAMTAESTLQALATGKLDINRIAQDVRKLAAQGQPDYVKDLLGQGYDLEQIYAPYRSRMASILELDPNAINLNDNALRMAIGKEGDLNLYDYERALRKDNRWQYTKNAREEVSNNALQVLRDFGFQG